MIDDSLGASERAVVFLKLRSRGEQEWRKFRKKNDGDTQNVVRIETLSVNRYHRAFTPVGTDGIRRKRCRFRRARLIDSMMQLYTVC